MHGCNGRMGQVITKIAEKDKEIQIIAGIDPRDELDNPYPVFCNVESCYADGDVIIDFSTAKAVDPLLDYVAKNKTPLVLCTTGLSEDQIHKVQELSTECPIFFSANMSLGINLMINLAKRAAQILYNANFDIEIIEKHHNQKIDAPSGTALAIADAINETLDNQLTYQYDRSSHREKRAKNELGIHAVRGGTIVGEHSLIFAGQDENFELKHTALSKEVFAVGAVKAAKFMYKRSPGLYNMGHLIEES